MKKGRNISYYRPASFEEDSDDEKPGPSNPGTTEYLDLTHKTPSNSNAYNEAAHRHNPSEGHRGQSETVRDDCCCSPRFFTTPCAIIGTVVTLVTVALLVLALHLGINKAEVRGHQDPYVYIDNFEKDDTNYSHAPRHVKFVLHGTAERFVKFESIPWINRKDLEVIDLEHVEVDIYNLLSTFSDSDQLTKLKNLTLKNVKFKGVMPWNEERRPVLPESFETLHLDVFPAIGREVGFTLDLCDTCVASGLTFNVSVLQQRQCLDSFLFFRKPSDWSGNLGDVGYNFFLKVGQYTLLNLNNVTGEVTSTLPYSDDLVRNVTKSKRFQGIRSLQLAAHAQLNVSTLATLSPTLKVLNLNQLSLEGVRERISSVLAKFSNLEELILSTGLPPTRSNFEVLLDDLPRSLKTLVLAHVQLRVNSNSTINFHLESVAFYEVQLLDVTIVTNFSKYFNARHVAWRFESVFGSGMSWTTVLEGIAKANPDSIFLDNWVPLSYPEILKGSKAVETMRLLGVDLGVSAGRLPMSVTFSKTKQHETFLQNYGHLQNKVENGTSFWFKLLKADQFIEPHFIV